MWSKVGNKHPFTLDKVFDHGASQEEVFFIATCSKRIGWLQGLLSSYSDYLVDPLVNATICI